MNVNVTPMRRMTLLICAICFGLPTIAQAVTADQLVGKWVGKSDSTTLEMTFSAEGKCTLGGATGDKTSSKTGTYKINGNQLVITPSSAADSITFDIKLAGDQLTLSGGEFGEGQGLTFTRGGSAPAADPAGKPKAPLADDAPVAKPRAPVANDTPPAAKDDNGIPGGKWETKGFESSFSIIKSKYDADNNEMTWLLERKDASYLNIIADFFDEDGVKITTGNLEFKPSITQVAKGERCHASLKLPADADLKRCVKVVVHKA